MRFFTKRTYFFILLLLLSHLKLFPQIYSSIYNLCTCQNTFICTNINFEQTNPGSYTAATSVANWSVSSLTSRGCPNTSTWSPSSTGFSIVSTPITNEPIIGNILHSPLGGTVVAKLKSNATHNASKITSTFWVPNSNPYLYYAYAGIWQGGNESCCQGSGFEILIKNASGVIQACQSITFTSASQICNNGQTFTITGGDVWTNWKVKTLDLSAFAGSSVSIEVMNTSCTFGTHLGTLYFDAMCSGSCCNQNLFANTITFCPGSNLATLNAPLGYQSYLWLSPGGGSVAAPQGTMSSITVTNPVLGSQYTVQLSYFNNCPSIAVYTIANTSVSISGLGASPSCSLGTSGSATVIANGSGSGYNYLWSSSSNTSIGTGSTVTNLSPGIYSIQVTAIGAPSCGLAMTTITVNTSPLGPISILKPYCGNTAYLSVNGGTNYQWYNGTVSIPSGAGGTASSYTVNPATNGSIYRLSYLSSQGCQDSLLFTLLASAPGNMSISYPNIICPGANNGQALITLTPAIGAPSGNNYFIVNSLNILPLYSSSIHPTSSNTFSLNGLSAGANYSVEAFDGSCKYTRTFSTNVHPTFDFTLSPNNVTLCAGNAIAASAIFSSNPGIGQYSYSWSPNVFLAGGHPNLQSTIIQPTANIGSSVNVIYSVAVTPSAANCPLTKTCSISLINLAQPSIMAIPQMLCSHSNSLQINTFPSGGTFISNPIFSLSPITNSTGILNPSLAQFGVNHFTYTIRQSSCSASSVGNYTVSNPQAILQGSPIVCKGNSFTVAVKGANNYLWNTGSNDSIFVLTPSVSTQFTVVATNTLGNCSASKVISIQVVPMPTVNITGPTNVCIGSTFTLNAQGANSYTWNNGSTSASLLLNANNSNSFVVNGQSNYGCSHSASILVAVQAHPTITSTSDTSVCFGTLIKLKANGADFYQWDSGTSGDSLLIYPQVNKTYTVTGFNIYGCKDEATTYIQVKPLPNPTLKAKSKICVGQIDTLIAAGAYRYLWEDGTKDSVQIKKFNQSQSFALTAFSNQNCSVTIPFSVQVNQNPELAISGKTLVCLGDSVALSASGADTFLWFNDSENTSVQIKPNIDNYYWVIGKTKDGCVGDKSILISVLNCDTLKNNFSFNVYPNPSKGVFYIETDLPIQTEIYFPWGQILQKKSFEIGTHLLDLSAYSEGIYLLKVFYNREIKIFKIIKLSEK